MNTFKCKYQDLELVLKYIQNYCKGSTPEIYITPEGRLEVTANEENGDIIKIRLFKEGSYFPVIIRESKLVIK